MARLKTNSLMQRSSDTGQFVIGLAGAAAINRVEGLSLTDSQKRRFEDFDKRGLTAAERRQALVEDFFKLKS